MPNLRRPSATSSDAAPTTAPDLRSGSSPRSGRARGVHAGLAALVVACGLAAQDAGGDGRLTELRLQDGSVVVGRVELAADDAIRVATRDGEVVVAVDDVVRRREEDELRASFARLEAGTEGTTAFGETALAAAAWRLGLEDEAWRHASLALALADDRASRRRVENLLATFDAAFLPLALRQEDDPRRSVDALVHVAERRRTGATERTAIAAILARRTLDAEDAGDLPRHARRARTEEARMTVVRALVMRGELLAERGPSAAHEAAGQNMQKQPASPAEDRGADVDPAEAAHRFLYRTTVLDRSPSVRLTAARDVATHGLSEDAVSYLEPGLTGSVETRLRIAEAFAEFGHPAAIAPLVRAAIAPAGIASGAVRAHVAVTEQRGYIRDFDVEVASASFIGDPQVDVLQSGVVLDATVAGTAIIRLKLRPAYRRALVRLTGENPGADVAKWPAWAERVAAARAVASEGTATAGRDTDD
jgi:hypothetical protein